MNHDLKTSSILEEGDALDVESNDFTMPRQHRSKTGLRLGLALVVLSAVGLAGLNHVGAYPFNRVTTPLQYLSMAQDKLMTAFSVRALADAADFKATVEGVIKEVGSADPSAMGMKATLTMGDGTGKWPMVYVTFIAQPGKQDKLAKKLRAIKKGVVDLECLRSRDEDCKKMGEIVKIKKGQQSVSAGKGEYVFVEVQMPKGPSESQSDKDMAAAFKEHDPRFLAELNFGRTIEDMYDNINDNVAVMPKGLSVKVSTAFATTLFTAMADSMPRSDRVAMKMMKGIAKLKSRSEILYKTPADLGNAFEDIPTFANELSSFKKGFQDGPKEVVKPMKGLQDVSAGIADIVVTGLPAGAELLVEFTNFHPSKVLNSLLS